MATFSNDELYGPCPCGSGKKLKFCCRHSLSPRSPADEARAIEEAIGAIERADYERVAERLEPFASRSTSPTLHILRAEAGFALGSLDGAIEVLRSVVDRVAPGHLHASAILAHMLMFRGEREEASAIVDRLVRARPRRVSDVFALLPTLALLGRDAELLALVDAMERPIPASIALSAGLAAWNLRRQDRLKHYVDLLTAAGDSIPLARLLGRVSSGQAVVSPWPRLLACDPGAIIPGGAQERVLLRIDKSTSPPDQWMSAILREADRVFLVASIANGALETARGVCTLISQLDPVHAREDLQAVWECALVPAEVARLAVQAAVTGGLVAADETLSMFFDGERHSVRVGSHTFGANKGVLDAVYGLPPHLAPLEESALDAVRAGRLEDALRGFEAILTDLPRHPAASFNRLAMRVRLGRAHVQEQLQTLRQIVQDAPRYLAARAALASCLLEERSTAEAEAVLQEEHLVDAADPTGHAGAAVILARTALGRNDIATARRLASMARAVLGADELRRRAPEVARLFVDDDIAKGISERRDLKRRKHLHRRVDADAPTADWFEHLTVEELKRALRAHGFSLSGSPRRADVLEALATSVDEGGAVHVVEALRRSGGDRVAQALVEAGGRLPYDAAARRFMPVQGSDDQDPLAAVLASGLAVLAAIDGVPSLALPPAAMRALGGKAPSASPTSPTTPTTTASPKTAPSPSPAHHSARRWQVATVSLPPIGTELPLVALVLDTTTGHILDAYVHPRVEPALAATIVLGRVLAKAAAAPAVVEVDHADVAKAVAAVLSDATVEVGPCKGAREALAGFLKELTERADRTTRETWAGRGVPLELAHRFHAAAAAIYRLRPWDVVPDDGCVLVLDSDDGLLRECCVVVMGQARLSFGVLMYRSLDDWLRARAAEVDQRPEGLPARVVVEFSRPDDVPGEIVAEMKRHKLPLAGPAAIPWLMAFDKGGAFAVATVDDTKRALLVLKTLEALLALSSSSWRGWRDREPRPTTVHIDGVEVQAGFSTAVA